MQRRAPSPSPTASSSSPPGEGRATYRDGPVGLLRVDASAYNEPVDDGPLLRNESGTTRARHPDEPVEELRLEIAIGRNVRRLRHQAGHSVSEMAARVGISKAMMSKIENAQTSCSLGTLSLLSTAFDVPVTALLRGAETEHPAMFVKAGAGPAIVREGTQEGHIYQLLGSLRGEHKRLECLHVTLSASSEVYPLFQHAGTEFIYVLRGSMDYSHGRSVYRLEPGDSLQFDGEGAHGPVELVDVPIHFLSVIAFPDTSI
jgi:transcriptional regulator with XRE-family HTH domain